MLFRAMACVAAQGGPVMRVFFEAQDHFEASAGLGALLSLVWNESPSRIDWWQLESEAMLRSAAGCRPGDDSCLLMASHHGMRRFIDWGHTQLLVGPATYQRLLRAQRCVEALVGGERGVGEDRGGGRVV